MEWLKNRPWLDALSELKPGKLYFATTTMPNCNSLSRQVQLVYTDANFVYEGFHSDFGPLHLGHLHKYCHMMRSYQQQNPNVCLVHCTGRDPEKRANAAYLAGAYAVLYLGLTPKKVCEALTQGPDAIPFKPFQDAGFKAGPHTITLEDCLNGLVKARSLGFFDLDDLDVEEMEEKRDMLGGDLSWLVPGRFVAFCGPSAEPNSPYPRPEQYLDYFHENGVTTVVRLNRKNYDAREFTDEGIKHFDVFLVDGSTPSKAVLQDFLDIAESERGAIAVHCKAGLGRTGTLVGAYLIKHYQMTALEAIAWLRICRPGSVIGCQQAWLQANEKYLTRQGDLYRKQMFGDSKLFELPSYGVYSKRVKCEKTNMTRTKKAQIFQNIPRRKRWLFETSSVSSPNEIIRANKSGVRASAKFGERPNDITCDEIGCLKRSASCIRKRNLDHQRQRYIPSIFESLTGRRKGHLDSGDETTTSETQGDRLNAVKLKRKNGLEFQKLPSKRNYGLTDR